MHEDKTHPKLFEDNTALCDGTNDKDKDAVLKRQEEDIHTSNSCKFTKTYTTKPTTPPQNTQYQLVPKTTVHDRCPRKHVQLQTHKHTFCLQNVTTKTKVVHVWVNRDIAHASTKNEITSANDFAFAPKWLNLSSPCPNKKMSARCENIGKHSTLCLSH